MSYCVNCGVELEKTEKICPLCLELVINPVEAQSPEKKQSIRRNYPELPVGGMKVNFRDLVLPISLILGIPVLITLICDFLLSKSLSWSLYVVLSIGLAFVYMVPPLAVRSKWKVFCVLADVVATALFLYLLDLLTVGEWFFPYAMPILLVSGLFIMALACIFMYLNIRKLVRLSLVLFSIGINSLWIDYIFKRQGDGLALGWSLVVAAACLLLAVVALIVNRNQQLKEQVRQRFFV